MKNVEIKMGAKKRTNNLAMKVGGRKNKTWVTLPNLLNLLRKVKMFKSCDFVQTILKFVFILNM